MKATKSKLVKTKKHIVQVSAYYPPHLGGQENAAQSLARQLALAGYPTHVLASAIGGKKGECTENKVHVRRLRGIAFGHAPIMPWFPVALFRTAHSDSIVHVHVGQAFTPEMVWLVAKLRGFKYIAELHIDFEPSGPAGVLLPLYKKVVLKRVLQSASAVVTLNDKTLHTVHETYACTGRAQVMDNGIDEMYFGVTRPPITLESPRILRLLFVGRLSKQKNIPALLDALDLTDRHVELTVVGDGEERDAVRTAIAKHNLKNVTLLGKLPREKVMALYATHDALVMPSLYEAQPLVLLEAMAARIPIIGTNVIGVAEHIKNAGIVVEPTPAGLASGIEQYYEQYDALPAMVERGYRTAEKLRWRHLLQTYEDLYDAVARD